MASGLARQPAQVERLDLAALVGTSPRRLHGWEPEEHHEYVYEYDAWGRRGNLLEVRVTRESEWNDEDRAQMLAHARFKRGICQSCGYHESLTADETNVFMPDTHVCPVCAGLDQWRRHEHDEDEKARKAAENAPARTPLPSDGRVSYMRLLPPDEAESLRNRRPRGE